MSDENTVNPVELTTEIAIAWLSNNNNRVTTEEALEFIKQIHSTVSALGAEGGAQEAPEAVAETYTPAVSVRKSLASKDHIVSMIDGKPYKTLRRHLAGHGLTPEQYRERYNLKADYPMVAEGYSEARRAMAKKIGLGRKPAADKGKRGGRTAGAANAG
ncbi:MucR family transcriptional regulator [Sphingomonas sp. 3-13AW]|uniref:MucR family transcriptional regulator n=1 Tax=Sphingomonas sp. 3-13AW TaxID=3050450 RepID=UPI003BB668DF